MKLPLSIEAHIGEPGTWSITDCTMVQPPSVYGTVYHEGLKVTDELGVYKIHFVFPESMDTSTPLSDEECRKLEAAETMLDVMTPIVKDLTVKCLETCRASEWKNLNGETLFVARVVIASCEPHVQAMIHSIRKFNADHGITS